MLRPQSLCHFLQTQLTAYYHLVSILETQMTEGSSEPGASKQEGETLLEGTGLTLMRLGVWTREVRLKMRLMSLMVEDCRCEFELSSFPSCHTLVEEKKRVSN